MCGAGGAFFDAQPFGQRARSDIAHNHFDRHDFNLPDELLTHVQAADEVGGNANMAQARKNML